MLRFVIACAVVALVGACGGRSEPQNVDVSQATLPQDEVSAAIDPRDPKILIAGSNSWQESAMRAYTSTDGGRTWRSERAPPAPVAGSTSFHPGDPSVAIDLRGREYYAFLWDTFDGLRAFVATRSAPRARWRTRDAPLDSAIVAGPTTARRENDKPALAIDLSRTSPHPNRVYAVWMRSVMWQRPRRIRISIVVAHSDDGARTWSKPVTVTAAAPTRAWPVGPSVAVGRGSVYVAWETIGRDVFVARSRDGDRFDRPVHVATRPLRLPPPCRAAPARPPAAPSLRTPIGLPAVAADPAGSRVAVVYERMGCNGAVDTWLTSFDASLRRVVDRRVNPRDGRVAADQEQPTAAYDAVTHDVWVCYYDTGGDPRRKRTRFTCTVSDDGGKHFAAPRAAASVPSDETGPKAAHYPRGHEYGDYQAVVAAGGGAHPFWTDSRDLATRGEEIYTTTLRATKR